MGIILVIQENSVFTEFSERAFIELYLVFIRLHLSLPSSLASFLSVIEDTILDKQTSDSLLPIIASQRERFRTRNIELEAV